MFRGCLQYAHLEHQESGWQACPAPMLPAQQCPPPPCRRCIVQRLTVSPNNLSFEVEYAQASQSSAITCLPQKQASLPALQESPPAFPGRNLTTSEGTSIISHTALFGISWPGRSSKSLGHHTTEPACTNKHETGNAAEGDQPT